MAAQEAAHASRHARGARVIADPAARGRALADFFARLEPRLWRDVAESGALHGADPAGARREWEVFALYACVRGLVAAGGFGGDSADAVDALHAAVVERWAAEPEPPEPLAERCARVSERYAEFGRIGQEQEARGPEAVLVALGAAAARHVSGTDIADAELGRMLGELHDAIAQGAAESARQGEP